MADVQFRVRRVTEVTSGNTVEIGRRADAPATRQMNVIQQRVVTRAKELAPVGDSSRSGTYGGVGRSNRPGTLRDSIDGVGRTKRVGPTKWTFQVRASADHAKYVVNGTRSHPIPLNGRMPAGKFLVFPLTPGGDLIYSKGVHHPGTTGNDFMARAAREVVRPLR